MSYVEPILLSLLETHEFRLTSAGAGLSRLEKMQIISDSRFAEKLLDVCVGKPEFRVHKSNCSKCWKCSRAMVNLDVLGKLEKFSNVFDLNYFNNNKKEVIKVVYKNAVNGKPADQDLVNLIKQVGYPAEVDFNYFSAIFLARRRIKRILKKTLPQRFRSIRRISKFLKE